ncbi:Ehrlichia chaffeensis immunodominant surface protein repeat-containing domain protein, partial [Paragonimus skrjabini miyazakii]
IYPSEFGIKRLAEEAIKGPPELVDNLSDKEREEKESVNNHRITQTDSTKNEHNVPLNPVEVDDKAGWRKASVSVKRRIRQYQLARLKYFYAIIEFDSPETAEAVYDACDGLEYESSGCRFDLRFVNDDEVFSVPLEHAHLVSECREINKAKYAPRSFETAALHSTRIGISWDKTPDERIDWLRDQFKPEADPHVTLTEDRQKLEKYLALSSSGASTAASSDVDEPPPAPTVPRIRRHRPKKLPPAELRAALLGATPSDSTPNTKDDDNLPDQNCDPSDVVDHEDEEEVLDLNETDKLTSNVGSTVEDYDLGPVEKKASKTIIKSSKDRKVRRLILPEAMDDMGDSSDGMESPEHHDAEKRRDDRKRRRRENQKNKILSKKLKVQERLEKQATLWPILDGTDSQTKHDDRFDAFLTDPAFQISQAHPNYKEAAEFLRYMRRRKVLLATLERPAASTESEMIVN